MTGDGRLCGRDERLCTHAVASSDGAPDLVWTLADIEEGVLPTFSLALTLVES